MRGKFNSTPPSGQNPGVSGLSKLREAIVKEGDVISHKSLFFDKSRDDEPASGMVVKIPRVKKSKGGTNAQGKPFASAEAKIQSAKDKAAQA